MTKERGLMVFSNEEFGQMRTLTIGNEIYFVARDLSIILGYKSIERMYDHVDKDDKIEINPQSKEYQGLCDNGAILEPNPNIFRMILINESGLYSSIFGSQLERAKTFRKWVTSEVLPKLRHTGSYDIIENNINKIQDEKERGLTLAIYNFEKVIESNPSDFMTGILLQQKKAELEVYKQEQRLNKVEESVNLIQEQSIFIPDRITFSEKVNVLARKYFNKENAEAYRALYNKMKVLGGFDVPRRLENRREEIQLDRLEQGKKPYAESTLKTKITGLDIIEEFNKWELASESYKSIENERFLEGR